MIVREIIDILFSSSNGPPTDPKEPPHPAEFPKDLIRPQTILLLNIKPQMNYKQ